MSAIIDQVETHEAVEMTRNRQLTNQVVPAATFRPKREVDVDALRALDKVIPYQHESSADLIRNMRDDSH